MKADEEEIFEELANQLSKLKITSGPPICDDILISVIKFLKLGDVARACYVNHRFYTIAGPRYDVLNPPHIVLPIEIQGVRDLRFPHAEFCDSQIIAERVVGGCIKYFHLPVPDSAPPQNIIGFKKIVIKNFIGRTLMQFLDHIGDHLIRATLNFQDADGFFQEFEDVADDFLAFFQDPAEIRFWGLTTERPLLNATVMYCNKLLVHIGYRRFTSSFDRLIEWLHFGNQRRRMTLTLHRSVDKPQILDFVDKIFNKLAESNTSSQFILELKTGLTEPLMDVALRRMDNATTGERIILRQTKHRGVYHMKRDSIAGFKDADWNWSGRTLVTIESIWR